MARPFVSSHNTRYQQLNPKLRNLVVMAPPPKKQKIVHNEEGQSAIIFHQPGLKPDVLLRVFDVDYHVHSIILKPHSAFFRKFLEPSNTPAIKPATVGTEFHELSGTITPASASATSVNLLPPSFRYVWITKIDHDDPGKWHLTSKYSDEKDVCPYSTELSRRM